MFLVVVARLTPLNLAPWICYHSLLQPSIGTPSHSGKWQKNAKTKYTIPPCICLTKGFWMRWLVGFMIYPVLASVRADLDVSSVIQYLISFPSIHISRYWDIASLTLSLPSHAVINCLSGMRSIMIITIFPNCCTRTDLIISSHEIYFINSHDLHCTPYHWIRH